jgi:hypothetical protein
MLYKFHCNSRMLKWSRVGLEFQSVDFHWWQVALNPYWRCAHVMRQINASRKVGDHTPAPQPQMFHALSRMSHRTHYLFASNLEPRKKYLHSLVRQLAPLYVYIMERTWLGLWWYQDHFNKNSVLICWHLRTSTFTEILIVMSIWKSLNH